MKQTILNVRKAINVFLSVGDAMEKMIVLVLVLQVTDPTRRTVVSVLDKNRIVSVNKYLYTVKLFNNMCPCIRLNV